MMDVSLIGLIAFGAVLVLLALRVPIAFALAGVATVAVAGPRIGARSMLAHRRSMPAWR